MTKYIQSLIKDPANAAITVNGKSKSPWWMSEEAISIAVSPSRKVPNIRAMYPY
jgi:hypothetical protein